MAKESPRVQNPFFIKPIIPNQYFCDREEETKSIVSKLLNGKNVVLTAERRIGKSSLLRHILDQPQITRNYNTLYVDLFGTKSPAEFIGEVKLSFQSKQNSTFPAKFAGGIDEITKEYTGKGGLDLKVFSLEASARKTEIIRNEDTLESIFRKLATTSKRNIIVFDEFQKIEQYRENITEALRAKIQMLENTQFIFSGSSVHLLPSMFLRQNQPFYNSSDLVGLKRIPEDTYQDFCKRMFNLYDKDIENEATSFAYRLLRANLLNLQQLLNETFLLTQKGETASEDTVKNALLHCLDERNEIYENLCSRNKDNIQRLINCIAIEGVASSLTSTEIMRRYNLGASSTIDRHLKELSSEDNGMLTPVGKDGFSLGDRFLELWIVQKFELLDKRIEGAGDVYEKELQLKSKASDIKRLTPKLQ